MTQLEPLNDVIDYYQKFFRCRLNLRVNPQRKISLLPRRHYYYIAQLTWRPSDNELRERDRLQTRLYHLIQALRNDLDPTDSWISMFPKSEGVVVYPTPITFTFHEEVDIQEKRDGNS